MQIRESVWTVSLTKKQNFCYVYIVECRVKRIDKCAWFSFFFCNKVHMGKGMLLSWLSNIPIIWFSGLYQTPFCLVGTNGWNLELSVTLIKRGFFFLIWRHATEEYAVLWTSGTGVFLMRLYLKQYQKNRFAKVHIEKVPALGKRVEHI